MKWRSSALIFGLGALIASAALAAEARAKVWPKAAVRVELGTSESVFEAGDEPALLERIRLTAENAKKSEVYLRVKDEVLSFRRDELGFSVDETETLVAVAQSMREATRSQLGFSARVLRYLRGEIPTTHVELVTHFDASVAEKTLARVAAQTDRAPEDAVLHIDEHRVEPAIVGQKLHVGSTLVRLQNATRDNQDYVEADTEILLPNVTERDVSPVDVTQILSSFVTSFRTKAGSRKINIRTAARYLDGAVLMPGNVLSFNERVGRRLHGRGFVDAPVILNDELEQDVGGGVCQVATTLHAAAIFGNLEVVERRSHSRPSGYAPLGLDATVIDGKVDLKLRNPYEVPLLVHAFLSGPYEIKVELLGMKPVAKVEHAYSVEKSENFARRIWVKDEVAERAFEQKQKGSPGMDVTSVVKVSFADGRVERRQYPSKYYPVPEVFWVGRGLQPSGLPALPAGVNAVMVEGQEVPLVGMERAEQ